MPFCESRNIFSKQRLYWMIRLDMKCVNMNLVYDIWMLIFLVSFYVWVECICFHTGDCMVTFEIGGLQLLLTDKIKQSACVLVLVNDLELICD